MNPNAELNDQMVLDYLDKNQMLSKSWFVENAPKEYIKEWFRRKREPLKYTKSNSEGALHESNSILINVSDLLSSETSNDVERRLTSSYAKIARGGRNSITIELFHDILSRASTQKKSSKFDLKFKNKEDDREKGKREEEKRSKFFMFFI